MCCTYVPTQFQAAWCFLRGLETSEAEFSLEGVTHLTTESPLCPSPFAKKPYQFDFW